ncbi:INGRESSION PROTEIN FIC1 [Salix viminalis]|uniref:INGRESSION PROTEIN FIC1 n=1 Tax=Salix viminalis TaxID=40686 RepID=A0A6N2KQB2_SALVM|nr:INGRESSION PROTEIN FIC1 [Salix viminalis]
MEITVISAQGLKNTSSCPFSHRLRPFITITACPPDPHGRDKKCQMYRTRVDDQGGVNPTWGDKFHVPIDTAFFHSRYSCIYLHLYTKRLITGRVQLGWCQVPVTDIGFPPEGSVQYLSYRIRARDGTWTPGVVNLAIRLTGFQQVAVLTDSRASDECKTVIGIPVTMISHKSICQ